MSTENGKEVGGPAASPTRGTRECAEITAIEFVQRLAERYPAQLFVTTSPTASGGAAARAFDGTLSSEQTHFSVGFYRADHGLPDNEQWRLRSSRFWSGMWCVALDDVGTEKVPTKPPVAPSIIIETSPGSEQWIFILNDPVTDYVAAQAICRRIATAGLTDAQGSNPLRLVRLPGSLPPGKTHAARLTKFEPGLTFDADDLLEVLGVPDLARPARTPSTPSPANSWWMDLPYERRLEVARELLEVIPHEGAQGTRHEYLWRDLGMPLHRALDGSDEGRELLRGWVQREWPHDETAPEGVDKFWRNLDRGGSPESTETRGVGTFVHLLQAHGIDTSALREEAMALRVARAAAAFRTTAAGPVTASALHDYDVFGPALADPEVQALAERIFDAPPMTKTMIEWGLHSSYRLNRPAALVGALVATSALIGNNAYVEHKGTQTVAGGLQVVLLGKTGSGKEHPNDMAKDVLALAEAEQRDFYGSSETGLQKELAGTGGAAYLYLDEIADRLESAARGTGTGAHEKAVNTLLMRAYGLSTKYLPARRTASKDYMAPRVDMPTITVLGCAVPAKLFNALSSEAVISGQLNRMLVMPGPSYGERNEDRNIVMPAELAGAVRRWRPLSLGGAAIAESRGDGRSEGSVQLPPAWTAATDAGVVERPPYEMKQIGTLSRRRWVIHLDDDAARLLQEFQDEVEEHIKTGTAEASLWMRAAENAIRVAGGAAALAWDPFVSAAHMRWAINVVRYCVLIVARTVGTELADDRYQAATQSAVRAIRELADEQGVAGWREVSQRTKRRGVRTSDLKRELREGDIAVFTTGKALNEAYGGASYTDGKCYVMLEK